ncbi:hypothetical protein P7C70_g1327, partial [Phenoliferia sp. Uapishka_3]
MSSYTPLPTTSSGPTISTAFWTPPPTSHPARPSLLQAATARPLRLALYGAGLIVTLLLIAGSTGRGPVPVRKFSGYATGRQGSLLDFNRDKTSSTPSTTTPQLIPDLPQNVGLMDPVFTKGKDGFNYPPDVFPSALNPYKRANAALVALVRNDEKDSMRDSMRSVAACSLRGNKLRRPGGVLTDWGICMAGMSRSALIASLGTHGQSHHVSGLDELLGSINLSYLGYS